MQPNVLATFTHAVQMAQSGDTYRAYDQLTALAKLINPPDPNLLLWIAFTSPDLTEAQKSIEYVERLDPHNPHLSSARQWYLEERKKPVVCKKCKKELAALTTARTGYDWIHQRCNPCQSYVSQELNFIRQTFLHFCSDNFLSEQEWVTLLQLIDQRSLSKYEVLRFIRDDALSFVERTLTFAASDNIITQEEEAQLRYLVDLLEIPQAMTYSIWERIDKLRLLEKIRKGDLPLVQPKVELESDELCYLEIPATHHRVNSCSVSYIDGRLVATSKRLHFLSPAGGNEIAWKSVMQVQAQNGGIYLELSKKAGNGLYQLADATLAEAVIHTLLRKAKYQLVGFSNSLSRF